MLLARGFVELRAAVVEQARFERRKQLGRGAAFRADDVEEAILLLVAMIAV